MRPSFPKAKQIDDSADGAAESIGQLEALEQLSLAINHLMALPESIGQLALLQYLNSRRCISLRKRRRAY